jgi:hypothetical protein
MKTNLTLIFAAALVAGSILGAAYMLRPLTPTAKCWNLRETWARRQQQGDPNFRGQGEPQELYMACLAAAIQNGGGH